MDFPFTSPRSLSRVHEAFVSKVEDAIAAAIETLARRFDAQNDEEAVIALRRTSKGGRPQLRLRFSEGPSDTFSAPDASFFHEESVCDDPVVVLEVSSRWDPKVLEEKAESYIMDSGGGINCVLGFDIDAAMDEEDSPVIVEDADQATCYGKQRVDKRDKTATLSIWRTDVTNNGAVICSFDADNYIFRNAAGIAQPGFLELRLDDLLGPDAQDRLDADALSQRVVVDFEHLAILLDEAEGMPIALESKKRRDADLRSVSRWRKRRKVNSGERKSLEQEAVDLAIAEERLCRRMRKEGII